MNTVMRAFAFARDAHESIGQRRKWTDEPYYLHPWRVAVMVHDCGGTDSMVMAAALHDVLEDVTPLNRGYDVKEIGVRFGPVVTLLVDELTHEFTKKKYPHLNRAERKRLEGERLRASSEEARLIKLCDNYDNISSAASADPKFAVTYARELAAYADCLPDCMYKPALLEELSKILGPLAVKMATEP